MSSPGVFVADEGAVRSLTLNRPERRNSLSVELAEELRAGVVEIPEGTRVVVLRAEPPAFCAGGDLAAVRALAEEGALAASSSVYRTFHGLVLALRACPVPVIAAVNGPALGAGLDLCLHCDHRIASAEASFASSWINLALIPAMGGAWVLPKIVGEGRAKRLLMSGERIDAATAEQWGLVDRLVEAGTLDDEVGALCRQLEKLDPHSLKFTKQAVHRAVATTLADELSTLGAVQGLLLSAPEFRSRADAFLERSRRSN